MPQKPAKVDSSPRRKTDDLYRGRVSATGACYFITFVTRDRTPWLASTAARSAMVEVLLTRGHNDDGKLIAAVVMPDHVHVLYELGSRLPIGRIVSRWKAQSRRLNGYRGEWQRDFWEHRIRDNERIEDYGFYMFLNPYRANLVDANEVWSGWCCPDAKRFDFMASLNETGSPQPEWLNLPQERFADLFTGKPKTT